jgi:hypothetical protein
MADPLSRGWDLESAAAGRAPGIGNATVRPESLYRVTPVRGGAATWMVAIPAGVTVWPGNTGCANEERGLMVPRVVGRMGQSGAARPFNME